MLDKLQKVIEAIRAFWYLRACASVGHFTRVKGRVIVNNAGKIIIGDRVKFYGTHVPIELGTFSTGTLTIGEGTSINSGVSICAQENVTIGKNCGIGNYSLIMDTDFHAVGDLGAASTAKPVIIGDNVWIAAHVVVLKGVVIGKGAVVSAGSVVAASVTEYTLVGGNPARFIKKLYSPEAVNATEFPAPVTG